MLRSGSSKIPEPPAVRYRHQFLHHLGDVKQLVLDNVDIQVVDAKSQEDITRSVLLQIILEEENGGMPMFSYEVLTQFIRSYGQAMQGMMGPFLENNLQLFAQLQQKMQEQTRAIYGDNAMLNSNLWGEFMKFRSGGAEHDGQLHGAEHQHVPGHAEPDAGTDQAAVRWFRFPRLQAGQRRRQGQVVNACGQRTRRLLRVHAPSEPCRFFSGLIPGAAVRDAVMPLRAPSHLFLSCFPMSATELSLSLRQAQRCHLDGDWAEAERRYRACLRDWPDCALAQALLAFLLLQTQRPEEAETWLQAAIAAEAGHADWHFNLGMALARQPRRPARQAFAAVALDAGR